MTELTGPAHEAAQDAERRRMEQRREHICDLSDELCRGKRHEAADQHLSGREVVERITGMKFEPDERHSFLCGWDAAMELTAADLAEENQKLHGIILDLCARQCVERCPTCKGEGCLVDGDIQPCPNKACRNGWVDKP